MASGALRRTGQILTGLAALLAVLALLFAAPVGLALLGGNPLPDHVPAWSQIADTLLRPDDGSLFIPVLTVVGWIAWAVFAIPVMVEAAARLRGVRTPRLPALNGPQKLAAGLLAAVSLLTASPAVAASTPAYAAPAAAPQVTHLATTTSTTAAAHNDSTAGHPATYQVRKGDYLSAISQRALGDEDRYPELAKLNHLADPDLILPGQTVRLPDGAHDHGTRTHATGRLTPAAEPEQPAVPGPAAGTDQGEPAPGPTTASTAEPSTTAMPTPAETTVTGTAEAVAPTAIGPTSPAAADSDGEQLVVPITSGIAGMGLLAALLLAALHRRRARQQHHRRPGRRIARPVDGRTETRLHVAASGTDLDRLDAGLRALAAGLADRPDDQWPDVVAAWIQHDAIHLVLTEPCPGEAPAPWLADEPTIWTLPAAAQLPADVDQLAPLPTLVGLAARGDEHLLVDLERLGLLSLGGDPERGLDLLRYLAGELATNRWSDDVYVTLAGFDDDQAQLLAGLNPHRITVADSVESAIARLRRQLEDTRAALQAAGADTALQGRATDTGEAWPPHVLLVAHPHPDHAPLLAELNEQLCAAPPASYAVVVADPATVHGSWPITVTADGQAQIPFLSDTALTASALPAAMLAPLADLLRTATILEDQETPPAPDTEAWAADTDAAGGLRDMLDVDEAYTDDAEAGEAAPAPMPVQIHTRPSAASATSWQPATNPIRLPVRATAPDPAVTEKRRRDREHRDPNLDADLQAWAAGDPSRPRISILGPVEITAPGTRPANRTHFYSELIVYLAARGARGATGAQLEDAIWRDQEPNPNTRRAAISRARTWLGDTPDGGKWMPQMGADQVYRITDGFLCDSALFRRARARGEARGPAGAGDLHQALDLVRGVPFDGVHDVYTAERTAYAWLPDSEIAPTHLVAAVVDTAHQLIDLHLAEGDLAGARWALEKAWLADPDRNEIQPWRDAMRIAHANGRDSELNALLKDLLRHHDAEILEDLDPETFRLVQHLQRQPPHRAAS